MGICLVLGYKVSQSSYRYEGNDFSGIKIPKDVDIYFTQGFPETCVSSGLHFTTKSFVGYFKVIPKDIYIMDGLDEQGKAETLVHELAHYDYYYVFTDVIRDGIIEDWKYFCQNDTSYKCTNPEEFYAEERREAFVLDRWADEMKSKGGDKNGE
jgi:hypothetical protein